MTEDPARLVREIEAAHPTHGEVITALIEAERELARLRAACAEAVKEIARLRATRAVLGQGL